MKRFIKVRQWGSECSRPVTFRPIFPRGRPTLRKKRLDQPSPVLRIRTARHVSIARQAGQHSGLDHHLGVGWSSRRPCSSIAPKWESVSKDDDVGFFPSGVSQRDRPGAFESKGFPKRRGELAGGPDRRAGRGQADRRRDFDYIVAALSASLSRLKLEGAGARDQAGRSTTRKLVLGPRLISTPGQALDGGPGQASLGPRLAQGDLYRQVRLGSRSTASRRLVGGIREAAGRP